MMPRVRKAIALAAIISAIAGNSSGSGTFKEEGYFKLCDEGTGPFQFAVRRAPDGTLQAALPYFIGIDNGGRMYVLDECRRRILIFARSGVPIQGIDYSESLSGAHYIPRLIMTDAGLFLLAWDSRTSCPLRIIKADYSGELRLDPVPFSLPLTVRTNSGIIIPARELALTDSGDTWYAGIGPDKDSGALFSWEGEFLRYVPGLKDFENDGRTYHASVTRQDEKTRYSSIAIHGKDGSSLGMVPGEPLGMKRIRGSVYFLYQENGTYVYKQFDSTIKVVDEIFCGNADAFPNQVSPNGAFAVRARRVNSGGGYEMWVRMFRLAKK